MNVCPGRGHEVPATIAPSNSVEPAPARDDEHGHELPDADEEEEDAREAAIAHTVVISLRALSTTNPKTIQRAPVIRWTHQVRLSASRTASESLGDSIHRSSRHPCRSRAGPQPCRSLVPLWPERTGRSADGGTAADEPPSSQLARVREKLAPYLKCRSVPAYHLPPG